MAKKFEYIEKNSGIIRQLVKTGDISARLILDYQIYMVWKGYANIKGKMDRYQFVAEDMKTSVQQVMKSIKSMEKNM